MKLKMSLERAKMNKNNLIASFQIDHLTLLPGLYLSRSDKGVLTYDLRFTAPNREPVLSTGIGHAIEHLAATYFRNSTKGDKIVYFGPMGCRTGFYLLVWDDLSFRAVYELIIAAMDYICEFSGQIPGSSPAECGNYSDMDLPGAKAAAAHYKQVLLERGDRSPNY